MSQPTPTPTMDESIPTAQTHQNVVLSASTSPLPADKTARLNAPTLIDINNVDFYYGASKALSAFDFPSKEKLGPACIGPSGCAKSSLLRCLNRRNDLVDGTRIGAGSIKIS